MKPESTESRGAVHLLYSLAAAIALVAGAAQPAQGQAVGQATDDTPSIKVGTLIFADYTYARKPQATDADGNTINPGAFNVSRAYVNVTGNISHLVAFRVTPDVFRETSSASAGNGSLVFRIKYAFAQVNLDDWLPKGSWVRLGIQQTPYVDFVEGIYRYRFQGTIFPEREGFLSSSDAGVSFHTSLPASYGDVHLGLYNGEGYSKAEANDQKAVQVRATIRPLPASPVLGGWRVTGFYDADNYVRHAERRRGILSTTFEQQRVNVGFDYLRTSDRTSAAPVAKPDVKGTGWAVWATPRFGRGFEALIRYDRMRPDADNALNGGSGCNKRTIAGLSYWFSHQGNVSSAVLFDVEKVIFTGFSEVRPTQQRLALHALISY